MRFYGQKWMRLPIWLPLLFTSSKKILAKANINITIKDISLPARVLAQFQDYLERIKGLVTIWLNWVSLF